jgi:hypothetical protein
MNNNNSSDERNGKRKEEHLGKWNMRVSSKERAEEEATSRV